MTWIKVVIILVVTGLMLVGATAFWTQDLRGPLAEMNWQDFKMLAVGSWLYQSTVVLIVGIAALLLRRWLRPQVRS